MLCCLCTVGTKAAVSKPAGRFQESVQCHCTVVIVLLTTSHTLSVETVSLKNVLDGAVKVVIVLKLSPTLGLPNILGGEMGYLHTVLLLHAGEGR